MGIPDQRELSENKAAHDCLLYLVKMHRELFMVSGSMPNVSRSFERSRSSVVISKRRLRSNSNSRYIYVFIIRIHVSS